MNESNLIRSITFLILFLVTTYKRSKRLIMSTFNQPTLDSYVATIAKNVTHFCKELEVFIGKGNFDIFPMAHHLTLKTTVGMK